MRPLVWCFAGSIAVLGLAGNAHAIMSSASGTFSFEITSWSGQDTRPEGVTVSLDTQNSPGWIYQEGAGAGGYDSEANPLPGDGDGGRGYGVSLSATANADAAVPDAYAAVASGTRKGTFTFTNNSPNPYDVNFHVVWDYTASSTGTQPTLEEGYSSTYFYMWGLRGGLLLEPFGFPAIGGEVIDQGDCRQIMAPYATAVALHQTYSDNASLKLNPGDEVMLVIDVGSEARARATPEPATAILVLGGGLAIFGRRRRSLL